MSDPLPKLEVEGGLIVTGSTTLKTDYASMKVLIESGMRFADVAREFKVSEVMVRKQAKKEGWLTPMAVARMRKDMEKRQAEAYKRSGKTMDVTELKARIWEERGEALKEKIFEIAEASLGGVTPEQAARFVKNPLGLAHMTTVVRQISGEEKREKTDGPQVAVNIGLLRSPSPVEVHTGE